MNEHSGLRPPVPPPLPGGRGPVRRFPAVPLSLVLLPILALLGLGWVWFFWRIEPGPGQIAVLIRKTGEPLRSGAIVASKPGQRGIQLDVLGEGRFFRNPYSWDWRIEEITDVPAGRLGVQTRLYGEDLPPGQIIASNGTKGIVAEILRPGRYRINPYAVSVQQFDAITIRPGHVGVVNQLVGDDVLNREMPKDKRNKLLVGPGEKGVVTEVLDPGTYYLNPYVFNVMEVNLQSQRFEMSGDDAISFLTIDGFTVEVEGTLEFALQRDKAALLTHRVGDMEDIVKKIILPRARGFSRTEGSKYPAFNYIKGETRQQFQDNLGKHLAQQCAESGVTIKSVLVRNIKPPDEIASIIREREVAVQDAKKFDQQIAQAISKAELTRQEMLALQNKAKVEAETERLKAVIQAQQEQSVRLTSATQLLEVARLESEAATFQAQAIISQAEAEGAVIRMSNEAEASVISNQVSAFGGGMGFSRFTFNEKVAPRIGTVLSSDQPDGLGGLFKPFVPPESRARGKEVRP